MYVEKQRTLTVICFLEHYPQQSNEWTAVCVVCDILHYRLVEQLRAVASMRPLYFVSGVSILAIEYVSTHRDF